MSTKSSTVAKATENNTTTAMVYDVVGLTETQADNIIATAQSHLTELKKTGNQCDFLSAIIDSVNTTEEKIFGAFVAGRMAESAREPSFMSLFQ